MPILVHFSSLIPKISMFTFVISYLITSNLSFFMGLIFQVPMQYCSLQHWISIISHVHNFELFCFASASLFFLELFFHSSAVASWASIDLGSSSFSVIFFFLPFHNVHGVLKATILKRFAIPFSKTQTLSIN